MTAVGYRPAGWTDGAGSRLALGTAGLVGTSGTAVGGMVIGGGSKPSGSGRGITGAVYTGRTG